MGVGRNIWAKRLKHEEQRRKRFFRLRSRHIWRKTTRQLAEEIKKKEKENQVKSNGNDSFSSTVKPDSTD